MSEKEKDILKTISDALPKMSEFDKGYFLGVAESRAAEKNKEAGESEEPSEEVAQR